MKHRKHLLLGLLSVVLVTTAVFAGDIEMKINGATDAVTIDKADGNEAMRVTANGNVGIGTMAPKNGLHIAKGRWASGVSSPQLAIESSRASIGLYDTNETEENIIALENAEGNFHIFSTAYTADDWGFDERVSRVMVQQTTGNVGIGTGNPYSKMSIVGSASNPSLDNDSASIFNIERNSGTDLAFTIMGGAPNTASIQHRHASVNNVAYPIALNPLGGNIGIGTSDPQETLDIRGTTATNDVIYEKVGRKNGGSTNWLTIFTRGKATAQSVAFIEISTVYNTPTAAASQIKVMARGNKTFSVIEQIGDAANGYNGISFQWNGEDFQVKTNNSNIYYSIKASLHSIGASHKWEHTWGTGW